VSYLQKFVGDITHADILRASATAVGVPLVATPGKTLIPLLTVVVPHLAVPYGGVLADGNVSIGTAGGVVSGEISQAIVEDTTSGMTQVTSLLVDGDEQYLLGLSTTMLTLGMTTACNLPLGPTGLAFAIHNLNAGVPTALTGGDARNFLRITMFYVEVDP
jgi:hypothetical protein